MKIAAAATALPEHRYDQQTILSALKFHWGHQLEEPEMLDRLHTRTGVEQRYLVLPMEQYPGLVRWGQQNNAWIDAAMSLGQTAICKSLKVIK